jgi:hypothetical protein
MIDRLREVRGDGEDADLARVKQQFGIITDMRNNIVHYGATLHGDGFRIRNTRTIPRLQTSTPVSVTDLDAMTEDLQTMAAAVYVHQCIESGQGFDPSNYATDWREVGRAPWHYKPPSQARDRGKKKTRKEKQPHPHQS